MLFKDGLFPLLSAQIFLFQNVLGLTKQGIPHQIPLKLESGDFDWLAIQPSEELNYVPCFDGLQCARLSVPLNWNNVTNARVALAVVKVPAKVPVTDPRYQGPILINPGGPGESGTQRAIDKGRSIQGIADAHASPSDSDDSSAKYFDVIGWDPRGVWHTTPRLKCFPDAQIQQSWILAQADYGLLWESDVAIALEWARMESLGRSCSAGTDNIIRFCNTAQTVEDMVALVDKSAEWREREIDRLSPGVRSTQQKTELLQYWGFSYGSLLGQTFASMHPERVGRMIIDGIVDPDDYYDGFFLKSLLDTDKVMSRLAEYCFQAGPGKCPIFTGRSAKDIEEWIDKVVWDLKYNAIPAPSTGEGPQGPEIIRFGDLQLQAIGAMAFPHDGAARFFDLLAQVARGNVSELVSAKQSRLIPTPRSKRCERDGPYSDACAGDLYLGLLGPTQAVECMDSVGNPGRHIDKAGFKRYLKELGGQSKWFSEAWAQHRACCIGFDVRPAWRYDGPIGGRTHHPLLIIGNTRDTVTPIVNARRVSTLFEGSAVLEQQSEGHCSGAMPSLCTAQVVRRFFQTGGLPPQGTVCEPEYLPFVGCYHKNEAGSCRKRGTEDEALWQAVENLA